MYLFIYLATPAPSRSTGDPHRRAQDPRCSTQDLQLRHVGSSSCSMWDTSPRQGIKPGPPALGARSPNHWTTREVPELHTLK